VVEVAGGLGRWRGREAAVDGRLAFPLSASGSRCGWLLLRCAEAKRCPSAREEDTGGFATPARLRIFSAASDLRCGAARPLAGEAKSRGRSGGILRPRLR
jgi:hypothetical protein